MKASYYMLEAVIGIVMIATMLVFLFKSAPESPDIAKANYKIQIYRGLSTMESTGELRKFAMSNDATSIKNGLKPYLPYTSTIFVSIYNKTFNNLTQPFSDTSNDIIGVGYFLVGDVGNYTPVEIRVHLWGFD